MSISGYQTATLHVTLPAHADGTYAPATRPLLFAFVPAAGKWRTVEPVAAGRRVGPRAEVVYRRALWTEGADLAAPKGLLPAFLPTGAGLLELPGEKLEGDEVRLIAWADTITITSDPIHDDRVLHGIDDGGGQAPDPLAAVPAHLRKRLALPYELRAASDGSGLAARFGLDDAVAGLLARRVGTDAETVAAFLEPDESESHDPFLMKGMTEASARVRAAVTGGERILIYGDYDADGIPGTALLAIWLRNAGANVRTMIPMRQEGYGLSVTRARAIAESGAVDLVITVDCGSSDHEAVALLTGAGIDVLVTDHHLTLKGVPPTPYFINPSRTDGETYPFPHLCGCGVAYKLVQSLSSRRHEPALYDLVAISTIGDQVPLTGENRFYVKAALRRMHREATGNLGLAALARTVSGMGLENLTPVDLGFRICPRINAAGRMGEDPNQVVELLSTPDFDRAHEVATGLAQTNNNRQELTDTLLRTAVETIGDNPPGHVIFAYLPECPGGVAGLVAAKLVDTYGRPVLVCNRSGSGSGRAPAGGEVMPYMEMLRERGLFGVPRTDADGNQVVPDYGGHAGACGFHRADPAALAKAVPALPARVASTPVLAVDAELTLADVTESLCAQLDAAGPYGNANPEPVFLFHDVEIVKQWASGTGRRHFRATLAQGGELRELTYFGGAPLLKKLGLRVDVLGIPEVVGGRLRVRASSIRPVR